MGEMKENGAASDCHTAADIVVHNDHHVIEMIRSPHFLMGFGVGQRHGSIVVSVVHGIAPAIGFLYWNETQPVFMPVWKWFATSSLEYFKASPWCAAVAFALCADDASPSQRAGKRAAKGLDQTARGVPGVPSDR